MAGWTETQRTGYPVLITAPSYLLSNWEKEIGDFLPGARVVLANGPGFQSRNQALMGDADFILSSYNNWSAKIGKDYRYTALVNRKWAAYIKDEGHRLRGRNSAWTKHVFRTRLTKSVNMDTPIWILTGTPFVRDGGDFFPYFHLWDKKNYRSYWKFVKDWCVVSTNPWTTTIGNIRKDCANEFRAELAKFSLRRTVSDVPQLASLEFIENEYTVDLPSSVVKMIQKAKKEYVLEHEDLASPQFLNGSGALYVAQRKLATVPPTKANPKIEWLKDFLTDKKGKVVVYTWFKDSARAVADSLGEQATLITGDIQPQRRDGIVAKWRQPGGPSVLVATIPSLKEGISLTEAADVVFLEHSELPADIEQCIKRVCRRGQSMVVQVHQVRANKSVDMVIKKVLDNRELGISEALAKWVAEDSEGDWFN